ncbi:MAG: FAD-dependent oxidoreductase [Rubripirellula sp.]
MVSSLSQPLDYLIIGGGPAGLQLGYEFEESGVSYEILEAGDQVGDFFNKYPRHRKLISINKVYTGCDDPRVNLRWDWNSLLTRDHSLLFRDYDRDYFPHPDALVKYLGDFADKYGLKVRCQTKVVNVSKDEDVFCVTDQHGHEHVAKVVIVATGVWKPYVPPIAGIEHAESYNNVSVDPEDFAGQRVLIIGKGNSAFETADNLVGTTALIHLVSPTTVKFAWRTHHVGHLRAVNNNLLDTYQLKSQNALLDADVMSIESKSGKLKVGFRYQHADDEIEMIEYDRVIYCTGFQFDNSLFDESCRPELAIENRFPNQTSRWESTNVPGLHFAGCLMQMRDFKKKQSAFIHGFRYNVRLLGRQLTEHYQGIPLHFKSVKPCGDELSRAVLDRINQGSALFQQDGFLCDLIVPDRDRKASAKFYEELSCDYVHDVWGQDCDEYYTITMEFGQDRINEAANVFAIERPHKDDVDRADESWAIHPIIRRWSRGKLVSTHHVIEDLNSVWDSDKHLNPLADYFRLQLTRPGLGVVGDDCMPGQVMPPASSESPISPQQ